MSNMNKPKWQERIEKYKYGQPLLGTPIESENIMSAVDNTIDDLIPIIAEEMQKQREEVIDECEDKVQKTHIGLPLLADVDKIKPFLFIQKGKISENLSALKEKE